MERAPSVAGRFYPGNEAGVRDMIAEVDARRPDVPEIGSPVKAGVVPHAGWSYSGPTASLVFRAIRQSRPEEFSGTFTIFATCHVPGVPLTSLYSSGTWATPLGKIPVDDVLAELFLAEAGGLVVDDPAAHSGDHAIEVQLPFIQDQFPSARILPIAVPFEARNDGLALGEALARAATTTGRDVITLASSDLTHYGQDFYGWAPQGEGFDALQWVREENDKRLVDLVLRQDAEAIGDEAAKNRNACGPGAISAAIAYARAVGAKTSELVDYTTSYDEKKSGIPTDFVGYAGIVIY